MAEGKLPIRMEIDTRGHGVGLIRSMERPTEPKVVVVSVDLSETKMEVVDQIETPT